MFVCTNEFIQHLKPGSHDERYDLGYELLTKIEGDKIRLFQLSDIHLTTYDANADTADLAFVDEAYELVETWRSTFGHPESEQENENQISGLLVSGDLLYAPVIPNDDRRQKAHSSAVSSLISLAKKIDVNEQAVLIAPGNHDINRKGVDRKEKIESFKTALKRLDKTGNLLGKHYISDDWARYPRLILLGNEDAVAAVFALDSNHVCYDHLSKSGTTDGTVKDKKPFENCGLVAVQQLERFQKTVKQLSKIYNNRPLHIIVTLHHHLLPIEKYQTILGFAPNDISRLLHHVCLDSRDLIETFQRCRVSIITHGHMHAPVIQQINYENLNNPGLSKDKLMGIGNLNIIGCPSFSAVGAPAYNGALVLTINKYMGFATVDVLARAVDGVGCNKRIVVPLLSASRCSAAEMRLYREMQAWLNLTSQQKMVNGGQFIHPPQETSREVFQTEVGHIWKESAYTLLCSNSDNTFSFPVDVEAESVPTKNYKLLLILRKDSGKPYILLNNHIQLRDGGYGMWDAPLLPAFNNLHQFLQQLAMDLMRQLDHSIQNAQDAHQHE